MNTLILMTPGNPFNFLSHSATLPPKKPSKMLWVLVGLVCVGAFFAGRAYGWYEADKFMAEVARGLGVVVQ